MSTRKKAVVRAVRGPRARSGRSRQRQHLIEACISALHIYGPSRTTVEKVVAIAQMSPGIVRFYFDSKAAMLVASLQFLSAEFEDRVLVPVTQLKTRPVAALQLMVDLYLDPDIASPRKVSVWYAFWGEASSRQEYYDICGQKDESSAALVRELIAALIAQTAQPHLDADGIALGLIGALEILWQDIAFQSERDIDRPTAKRRCMAYLQSIFPGCFATAADEARPSSKSTAAPLPAPVARLPRWAYRDARLWGMEREALFQPAWAVAGHESQLPRSGDFITADTGVERVLLIRDDSGVVRAVRNCCPEVPHALVNEREGHVDRHFECAVHGLRFFLADIGHDHGRGPDRRAGLVGTAASLTRLDVDSVGGFLWVRASGTHPGVSLGIEPASGLMMLRPPTKFRVAADWKVLVEQWLDSVPLEAVVDEAGCSVTWDAQFMHPVGWSGSRYAGLMACLPGHAWRRQFIAPHQLLEARPDGFSILQALPTAPGRTLLRRFDYSALPPDDSARASLYLAQRLGRSSRQSMLQMAESVQRGMIDFGYESPHRRATAPAGAWFRAMLAARIPALLREQPPADRQTSL